MHHISLAQPTDIHTEVAAAIDKSDRILGAPKSIQVETVWLGVLQGLLAVRHYVTPPSAMWNLV